MAKVNDVTLEINIDNKDYEKKLSKCTKLAKDLNIELEKLQNIEIGIDVVRIKKKWYQFWKK